MTAEVVAPFKPGDLVLWFDSSGCARVGEYAGPVNDVVINKEDSDSPYRVIAERLRANPNQWSVIDIKPLTDNVSADKRKAISLAALISQGRLRSFRPRGAFQAMSRTTNGFVTIWARFVTEIDNRPHVSIDPSNFDMSDAPLFDTVEDQSQYSVVIVKDDEQPRKIVLNNNLLPWRRDV